MKSLIVYITTADEKDAEMIGAALVKKKLASCAMTLPGVHSQYFFEDKFQHDKEVLMLIKTFDTKYNALEKMVKKMHCYKTPMILALPVTRASKDYLNWSKQVTQ